MDFWPQAIRPPNSFSWGPSSGGLNIHLRSEMESTMNQGQKGPDHRQRGLGDGHARGDGTGLRRWMGLTPRVTNAPPKLVDPGRRRALRHKPGLFIHRRRWSLGRSTGSSMKRRNGIEGHATYGPVTNMLRPSPSRKRRFGSAPRVTWAQQGLAIWRALGSLRRRRVAQAIDHAKRPVITQTHPDEPLSHTIARIRDLSEFPGLR